jgi:hypothetical protein
VITAGERNPLCGASTPVDLWHNNDNPMSLRDLTADERAVVRQCLKAAADGPFFPDWEFEILFGITRADVRSVQESWPPDRPDQMTRTAINHSLNNLLHYPHRKNEAWSNLISVSRSEVHRIYQKWKGRSVDRYIDGFGG